LQSLQNDDHPLVATYEDMLHPTTGKVIYLSMSILFSIDVVRKLPWRLVSQIQAIVTRYRMACTDLVYEKKSTTKSSVVADDDGDMTSLLIESDSFSIDEIVSHVQTFLLAGHETTASGFGWVLYLLATHIEIQTALREEIRQNVPSMMLTDPLPTSDVLGSILESLPLLNGVLNESLRLFPPLPLGGRTTVRPTTLMGYDVPVGTPAIICPWAVNRNPQVWGHDSDDFVPERWIDTNEETGVQTPNNLGGAGSTYAVLTFFYGPRTCPGQGFARAELRCLLAAFVGKFDMAMADPNKPILPRTVSSTRPKHGLNLKLTTLSDW
jgi:cytochrome P450